MLVDLVDLDVLKNFGMAVFQLELEEVLGSE